MSDKKEYVAVITTEITATAEEIHDLIVGSGALSYPWWEDATPSKDETGWDFTISNYDQTPYTTSRSFEQIMAAVGSYISGGERCCVKSIVKEGVGGACAADADVIMQLTVFDEIIYG